MAIIWYKTLLLLLVSALVWLPSGEIYIGYINNQKYIIMQWMAPIERRHCTEGRGMKVDGKLNGL